MLDHDLASLYGVETGALNRAVKRNLDRFPPDFMFQLTPGEAKNLRCQFGISSSDYGGRRYLHYAFTKQGVAMLLSLSRGGETFKVTICDLEDWARATPKIPPGRLHGTRRDHGGERS